MNNIELDFNFCIIWHSPRNHHHAQCVRVYGNTFTVYPHTFIGLCVCTRNIRQECLLLFGVYKWRRAYFRDWNSLHCEIVKRRVEEFSEPKCEQRNVLALTYPTNSAKHREILYRFGGGCVCCDLKNVQLFFDGMWGWVGRKNGLSCGQK